MCGFDGGLHNLYQTTVEGIFPDLTFSLYIYHNICIGVKDFNRLEVSAIKRIRRHDLRFVVRQQTKFRREETCVQ